MIINFCNTFPPVTTIHCYHPKWEINILYYSSSIFTGIERTQYQFDPKNTVYYISSSPAFKRPCYTVAVTISGELTEIRAHDIPDYDGISECSEFSPINFSELWL